MAAEPIRLEVSGYYQFYALASTIESNYALDGTSAQYKGIQYIQNGEIFFTGQTKLDNGTSVAIGSTGSNRQIDKAYFFAFGNWGRLEFGAKDDAAYIMYYGAPAALLGFGFFKHNTDFSWTNPTANGFNMAAFHISASTIDAEYQLTRN